MLHIEKISFKVNKLQYENLVKALNSIDYLNVYEQENETKEGYHNGTISSYIDNTIDLEDTRLSDDINRAIITVQVPSKYMVLLKDFEYFTILEAEGYHEFENHHPEEGMFWDTVYEKRVVIKFKNKIWFFEATLDSEKQGFVDFNLCDTKVNIEIEDGEVQDFLNFKDE